MLVQPRRGQLYKPKMTTPNSTVEITRSPAVLEFVDAQALDAKVERRRREPQCARRAVRAGDSSARDAQRGLDRFALLRTESFVDISHQAGVRQGVAFNAEDAVAGEDDRPLDDVFEFAHVAGPMIRFEQLHRATVNPVDGAAEA